MDLFNTEEVSNLLPYDGIALYYGCVVTRQQAADYLHRLLHDIQWKNDEAIIFGKHIVTGRKVAWYGDSNYAYTYSNTTKEALPWTDMLLELKQLAEQRTGETFNSCLLNLYHHGGEGMSWHSDDEKSMGTNTAIASLSFGAERKFSFKHKKDKNTNAVVLQNGSLLLMKGATQTNWLHCLPKTSGVKTPRVNLTFRRFIA